MSDSFKKFNPQGLVEGINIFSELYTTALHLQGIVLKAQLRNISKTIKALQPTEDKTQQANAYMKMLREASDEVAKNLEEYKKKKNDSSK